MSFSPRHLLYAIGGTAGVAMRAAILGAGAVGVALARKFVECPALGISPVAFFDTRFSGRGVVEGLPVFGHPSLLLEPGAACRCDLAIVAGQRPGLGLLGDLARAGIGVLVYPCAGRMRVGKLDLADLRGVELEDVSGNESLDLDEHGIADLLHGATAMVSGAGGSIGSELCRQIASFNPQRLLLVEQSEVQLFQVEQDLIQRGYSGVILPLVADILDQPRMRFIMDRFRPSVIFHAAAHKHVPMMENQPGEAIKNNTLGTAGLARLALEFGVDRFVLISTDKAINPTNVMGATKRMAEIFIQALHAANPGKTKFMAVRFGNVLGSSGSVIPTFKRQIANGGPVTVTHPDMTRYFMTIPEAVGLVLQSATQGSGGEIFVLDMGQPVKIVDLARQLIELSGYRSDEDIMIEFTGLRPGEKLFEELSHQGENITPTNHSKIMRFVCDPVPLEQINLSLDSLRSLLESSETDKMKRAIKEVVPEYVPYLS